jgi:hypothetical protein
MEVLGEVGQVEARFSPFRDSVSLSAREVHGFRLTYHRLRNHFVKTMEVLGDVG